MIYLALTTMFIAGMACSTFLVVSGHPCFGAFAFLITGCLGVSRAKSEEGTDDR